MRLLQLVGLGISLIMLLMAVPGMIVSFSFVNVFQVLIASALGYACYVPLNRKSVARRLEEARRASEAKANTDRQLALIRSGEKPVVPVRSVLLRRDEVAYLAIDGVLMENQTTGYEAGTNGVRIRVAEGVSVGSSRTRGKAIKSYVAVSKGEFVITNIRVVFAGAVKSFDIPLAKLTNFHFLDDNQSVVFHVGSKSHTVALTPAAIPIAYALLSAA